MFEVGPLIGHPLCREMLVSRRATRLIAVAFPLWRRASYPCYKTCRRSSREISIRIYHSFRRLIISYCSSVFLFKFLALARKAPNIFVEISCLWHVFLDKLEGIWFFFYWLWTVLRRTSRIHGQETPKALAKMSRALSSFLNNFWLCSPFDLLFTAKAW